MFVQQYVFEFQVAVDARLVVDIGNSANELGEYALDFGRLESTVFQEIVVELVTRAVLEDQPD